MRAGRYAVDRIFSTETVGVAGRRKMEGSCVKVGLEREKDARATRCLFIAVDVLYDDLL